MKKMTTKEHLKGIASNTKQWVKEHWKGIALGGLAILGGTVIVSMNKKSEERDEESETVVIDTLDSYSTAIAKRNPQIDEDIYTNVALQMESLIFDDSCDEGVITTTYEVEYPKNGDYSEGSWTGNKEVTVTIKDVDIENEEDK